MEESTTEELDNHFVKLDNLKLDEVPDVPLLDNLFELEIRGRTTARATMLKLI